MKKLVFSVLTLSVLLLSCEQKNSGNLNPQKSVAVAKEVQNRANFGVENVFMIPEPTIMIATYDANQKPDVMMAAWGSQCGPKHICFYLSQHKTTDNIRLKKAFTVSFASEATIVQSDYFGIVSANDEPAKVEKANFTATPSPNVDAPIIKEYPLTLECKVVHIGPSNTGEARGGTLVVGEVVNISADASILTDGQIDMAKLKPVVYDPYNHTYCRMGDAVGKAWGSGKVLMNTK